MKKKLLILTMIVTITGSLLIGCGKTGSEQQQKPIDQPESATTQEGTASPEAETGDASNPNNEKIATLIKEQNEVMKKNEAVWEKVLAKIDNEKASKQLEGGQAYDEFLKETIKNADSELSNDEKQILQKDMQRIEELEKEIAKLKKE